VFRERDPETAAVMNETRKPVVFHRPFAPGWHNASVIHGDVDAQI
jgi:hypothetical protein